MACDGFITFKILELILSIGCIIFKRVTDDKANKLFYFLQKNSREWPLLNNIFWDENGAIFADMTYGGYVIISTGLLIGQAKGELRYARFTENFLLTMGALMYFGSASLELAALDSVQPNLVINAAILGVVSLITGLIFILDLLLAGRRRKRPANHVRALGYDKPTQTDTKPTEIFMVPSTNEQATTNANNEMVFKKVPTNGVKILPSSPTMEEVRYPNIPGTSEQPIYTAQQLKSPNVKIKSTESFLRSEKGEMPIVRRERVELAEPIFVPPGYFLVPAKPDSEVHTPPGYASVEPKFGGLTPRKLQSPTITTTKNGYYYHDSREPSPTEDQIHQQYGKYPARSWPEQPNEDTLFKRNGLFRSSKQNLARYDGSDSEGRKIDEELRHIRNITRSDAELAAEIEKENQELKDVLRKEQEEKAKLKTELKKVDLEERRRLEDRVNELEEYQAKLEKELKMEERKKLEQKIRELEDEKDRRMSENVQFFGVKDLSLSQKESSPVHQPKLAEIEEYFKMETEKSKGAKETNAKLKEKHSDEELRKVIEEGFNFLDEEERKKRSDQIFKEVTDHKMKESKKGWREEDVPSRAGTPGSFRSETQLWLGGKELPPLSPKDPGFVQHQVQNWQNQSSPNRNISSPTRNLSSPTRNFSSPSRNMSSPERFAFSARKANQVFRFEPSPSPERGSSEEEDRKITKTQGRGRGMLLRKTDFPRDEIEIERPSTVAGNTSSWRRWLNNPNKPKLQSTRSTPA